MRSFSRGLVATLAVLSLASVAYAQQGDLTAQKNSASTSMGHTVSSPKSGHSSAMAQSDNAATNAAAAPAPRPNINAESAYATGEGLNGPPAHFRAIDTPE